MRSRKTLLSALKEQPCEADDFYSDSQSSSVLMRFFPTVFCEKKSGQTDHVAYSKINLVRLNNLISQKIKIWKFFSFNRVKIFILFRIPEYAPHHLEQHTILALDLLPSPSFIILSSFRRKLFNSLAVPSWRRQCLSITMWIHFLQNLHSNLYSRPKSSDLGHFPDANRIDSSQNMNAMRIK